MTDRGMVEEFVAGAIGEPGDRTFLLQFRLGDALDTYVLEKTQVAALAEQALELLDQIGFSGAGAGAPAASLEPPEEIIYRIGGMQLGYDEGTGVLTLVVSSVDDDPDANAYDMTPALLDRAMRHGLEVVSAGRPTCPRCGLAMDPDGHHCPKDNGDLRHHRA